MGFLSGKRKKGNGLITINRIPYFSLKNKRNFPQSEDFFSRLFGTLFPRPNKLVRRKPENGRIIL
jgi:hypothetical protein